jgi:hypothetical protein
MWNELIWVGETPLWRRKMGCNSEQAQTDDGALIDALLAGPLTLRTAAQLLWKQESCVGDVRCTTRGKGGQVTPCLALRTLTHSSTAMLPHKSWENQFMVGEKT